MFLETVCGVVTDSAEKISHSVKILLDKGAMSTYIVDRVVEKLKLMPKATHKVKINGFADKHGETRLRKEYLFCVKNPKVGCNVYLRGLAVPFIAQPLSGQRHDVVLSTYPQLRSLDLCDVDDGHEIDILIGSDYYNCIVGDEKRRFGETGELVAVNSKLGWILSGPCEIPTATNTSEVRHDYAGVTATHATC